jgi:AcrR family transcriptional regulator
MAFRLGPSRPGGCWSQAQNRLSTSTSTFRQFNGASAPFLFAVIIALATSGAEQLIYALSLSHIVVISMDPAPTDTPPLMTKGQRTAQRILDAAEILFANQGIESTTLKQIAEQAQLKEPSLYKHYESKDAMYVAVINRAVQPLLKEMEELLAHSASLPELMNIPRRMMKVLGARPTTTRILHREISKSGDNAPPSIALLFEQIIIKHQLFVSHMTGKPLNEKTKKTALLRAITTMNMMLGYYASAPFFSDLIGSDLLDDETIHEQTRLVHKLFATILLVNFKQA